jgi:adenosylmethionine---8-amino-7-oxononanoate aminotransferase
MSLQVHQALGSEKRTRFASLSKGYHGETLATLSLCDQANYSGMYQHLTLHQPCIIQDIPYVQSATDPLWADASLSWQKARAQLEVEQESLAAIILEPVCQAPGGMRFYSPDFLKRLSLWAQARGIHVIADEITTGFWRLGQRLASDFVGFRPDFTCLGKALTGGFVAMSAVVFKQEHYSVLSQAKFVHSNAYAGNAIAAAAALATCRFMEEHDMKSKVAHLEARMKEGLEWLATRVSFLENTRVLGGIAAAEIASDVFEARPDFAQQFSRAASEAGVFLRPLQNTIYWCPPLLMNEQEADLMITGTEKALKDMG